MKGDEIRVYPPKYQLVYTKKPESFPIPHQYKVKTIHRKKKYQVECSIEYVDGKPLYNVQFGENMEYNVCSTNSSSGAGNKYITALLMLEKNKTLTEEDIKKINKDATTSSKISGVQLFGLQHQEIF
ncbi:hypothetical protein Glove_490g30 [Diversispora epigaea]|uniref:Uncharacterized protein n=1 Tax=Diversispora epigaea TaxID=1348612 RepID=A0A397GMV2_9GLOM|nr:hypothetical protein Glove_490g30 [Diversispora epigaea]